LERLRFTSPHPKDWDAALTDLVAARATICNHLHLPFQSGSDRILEKMRRRHTRAELLEQLHYLRKTIPSVEVTTDLIVGFPGETEADFEQTLDVVRQARFAQIFAFKYSPRPGTAAAQWEDDVPKEVKEARLERILTLQDELNAEMLEAYAGRLEKVLIDAPHPRDPGAMNGRTEGHRPVKVAGAGWSVGDLVWTRISGYSGHWLEAEPLERRHESASTP
jgi:tRNA-2-methylthio-N6-dimethylallyladenosine synthase